VKNIGRATFCASDFSYVLIPHKPRVAANLYTQAVMVSVYKFTDVLQLVVNKFVELFAQISELFVSLLAIGILCAFEHNTAFLALL
jgi:hypothetical protein